MPFVMGYSRVPEPPARTIPFIFSVVFVNHIVETSAQAGIGTYLTICHSHMFWMHSIGFQSSLISKSTVKHYVCIGRIESSVNIHDDIEQSRNTASQAFETCLNVHLDTLFLFFCEVVSQLPQYDVLYHNIL